MIPVSRRPRPTARLGPRPPLLLPLLGALGFAMGLKHLKAALNARPPCRGRLLLAIDLATHRPTSPNSAPNERVDWPPFAWPLNPCLSGLYSMCLTALQDWTAN